MWINDPYWLRAARCVLELPVKTRYILAPPEMNHLRNGCLPLAFSHILEPRDCVIVLPKDDVDQLPLKWIEALPGWKTLYADEVFVAVQAGVPKTEATEHDHLLPYMHDRCAKALAGIQLRVHRIDEPLSDPLDGRPYILLALASLTGNAGDRILAAATARFLRTAFPHLSVVITDGNPDRTLVSRAEAVITGIGGVLFDLENATRLDLMNLVNWFRFGFLAAEYDRPLYCLGLGHQNIVSSIGRAFAKAALKHARIAATRDSDTASILVKWLDVPVQSLPDMSALFADDIGAISKENGTERILSLCGDFRYMSGLSVLASWIRENGNMRLRYVVQANEDADGLHIHRQSLIEALGGAFEEIDCRTDDPAKFCNAIATSDAVITTRFHGMMLTLMAGTDCIIFTAPGDKRARVRDEIASPVWTRFLPPVARFEDVEEQVRQLLANGRRVPERAVVFDHAPFLRLQNWLTKDLARN